MAYRILFALFAVSSAARAQTSAVDREAALKRLREFARTYEARLEDFRCNKVISRIATRVGKENKWKHVDESEEEIYYLRHRERRQLITIDGKPSQGRNRLKYGFTVGGEFGLLGNIFSDKANPELGWDHQEGAASSPICVFRYHVAETDAPLVVSMNRTRVELGHHGTVYSHCDTGVVTRLDTASDSAPDWDIELSTSIRFAPTLISNKQFQLPQSAEDLNRINGQITKALVVFRNYRKFDASSEITFDTGEETLGPK